MHCTRKKGHGKTTLQVKKKKKKREQYEINSTISYIDDPFHYYHSEHKTNFYHISLPIISVGWMKESKWDFFPFFCKQFNDKNSTHNLPHK